MIDNLVREDWLMKLPRGQAFLYASGYTYKTRFWFSSGLIATSKLVILEVVLFVFVTLKPASASSPAGTQGERR
jgi:hypothetical protein